MKKHFTIYIKSFGMTLLLLMLFACNGYSQNKDTIVVEPGYGTLNDAIAGDTLSNGSRANLNRVYKVKRGGLYYLNGSVQSFGWPLRIVGEAAPASTRPAVLLPGVTQTGASDKLFRTSGDVTITNCYFLNLDPLGKLNTTVFEIGLDGSRISFDNCVCEFDTWVFVKNNAAFTKFYFTNCTFKNEAGPNNWSNGHPFDPRQNLIDTVLFQNCTFHSISSHLITDWSMNIRYVKFDHNTCINIIKNPLNVKKVYEFYCTNNVFYDCAVYGTTRLAGGNAIKLKDTLYMSQGFLYPAVLDPDPRFADSNRVLVWSKNSIYHSDKVKKFWAAGDTNFAPIPIMNDTTRLKFFDNPYYPNIKISDTLTINPGFTSIPTNIDSLILYCQQMGFKTKPTTFANIFWKQSTFDDSGPHVAWPMEINFTYPTSNAAYTAGAGSFPLGDLNWFPAKKAQWMAATGVEEKTSGVVKGFELAQNYPNPFNPVTNINFSLISSGKITLKVYDILGKEVAVLADGFAQAGKHQVTFDASRLSSGVYIYRLTSANQAVSHKMVLIK